MAKPGLTGGAVSDGEQWLGVPGLTRGGAVGAVGWLRHSGGRSGAEEERGEVRSMRAAPGGDEGGSRRSDKEPVQGVRRGEHLQARSAKELLQGVRRGEHLLAQSDQEPMQDEQSRQGRVHAAGSRGALTSTHTSFCPGTSAVLLSSYFLNYSMVGEEHGGKAVLPWSGARMLHSRRN